MNQNQEEEKKEEVVKQGPFIIFEDTMKLVPDIIKEELEKNPAIEQALNREEKNKIKGKI